MDGGVGQGMFSQAGLPVRSPEDSPLGVDACCTIPAQE